MKRLHVGMIFLTLSLILNRVTFPDIRDAFVIVPAVIVGFILVFWGCFIVASELKAILHARRLRRIAGEAGSEAEEGYTPDWMDRPL
jgi:hypothetical protein